MNQFLEELAWRGLVQDQTPGLAQRLAQGPITAYVGFDPTAKSLQVGNLIPLMLLAHLQRAGGKPIVLLGGGTGLIGDPSGKRNERPLLPEAEVAANVARQRKQFERFLDFGPGSHAAEMLDNAEWLRPFNLVAFLRDVGKHFTLSYMLQKESVKGRMEEGISYTEFSYMLLQAYDFLQLYRTRRCELQMGGSDQWGNITAGIELIRRMDSGEAHGLAAPLLTTATGNKFGKTEGGAVWLDPAMTPPYVFYNYWVNTDDRDVEQYLKLFSFKTQAEIVSLLNAHRESPEKRIPHHALAKELTEHVHGEQIAAEVERETRQIFARRMSGDLTPQYLEGILDTVPKTTYTWSRSKPPSIEDLAVAAGLAKSKSEARRLLAQQGLYLNENIEGVPKPGEALSPDRVIEVKNYKYLLLRKGKKTHRVVDIRFVD